MNLEEVIAYFNFDVSELEAKRNGRISKKNKIFGWTRQSSTKKVVADWKCRHFSGRIV